MRYKPNQYLICDSYGNYYLRITLPVYMQPFFEGKRTFVREGANKQVISSQADSLIKISRIWADFFPVNTSNQPI